MMSKPPALQHAVSPTPLLCSCRLTLALIGFFMFFHLYAQRVGMSVAIVCMVNQTAISHSTPQSQLDRDDNYTFINDSAINVGDRCSEDVGQTNSSTLKDGPFAWEKETQGHILGAFFYGYLVSQIPAGLLAERFGAKWVIVTFLGLSTVGTLLTPVAARISLGLLIALRVLVGIGSGAMFPAMHAMLGQWTPPLERSKLCAATYTGTLIGNVVTMPVTGLLCEYGFDDGWGSVFYIIGLSSAATIVIWCFLTSNTPATHPRISESERFYIVQSLKGEVSENKPQCNEVPWSKFLTSGPVWAIIISNFCADWGFYTYLTNIPTFYREVLHFDMQSNGLYSALPFLGLFGTMTITPTIADKLRSSGVLSTVVARKLFNSLGMLGAGSLIIWLSFLDCTQTTLAVAVLTLAVSVSGLIYSGYFVNHMDIAPRYAGTLMGIANGLSSSAGFITPVITAIITKPQTRESWQIVFFITAGVYVFGAVSYCILADGKLQPWARDQKSVLDDIEVKESIALNGKDPDHDKQQSILT